MKTFTVRGPRGVVEVEQRAEFTESVQGEQFDFVVLKTEDGFSLTERTSTKRVCLINAVSAIHEGYVEAGKSALAALVMKHGAARVRSVLAGA